MYSVMQNPLPDYDVARVAFVITAGVQIAVVFWERRGGDDDAQTMPGGITHRPIANREWTGLRIEDWGLRKYRPECVKPDS